MKRIVIVFYCLIITSSCHNDDASIAFVSNVSESRPLTIQYLIDSLNLRPILVKNNQKELVVFNANKDNGLHLDFNYRKLSDGLWALADSLTNSPYYLIEVKAGKRAGFYALAAAEQSFLLSEIGEYANDKRNGEFTSYDFRGLLYSKSKYLKGTIVDSQFIFTSSGSVSQVIVYKNERAIKIIAYDSLGKLVSEKIQCSDSILNFQYINGR